MNEQLLSHLAASHANHLQQVRITEYFEEQQHPEVGHLVAIDSFNSSTTHPGYRTAPRHLLSKTAKSKSR